jgi:hypothetical protein
MNWKNLAGNGRGLIRVLFRHLLGWSEEDHENIVDILTEIRTKRLPHTSIEYYSEADLFLIHVPEYITSVQ